MTPYVYLSTSSLGIHAFELAKTAYNGFITGETYGAGSGHEGELLRRAGWYLVIAKHVLGVLGPEGDADNGVLDEAEFLRALIEEERVHSL